ncbi:DsbA family protein [Rufibacter glacialis]|uniref:DsbA family protein n=1 Tax=Rufibacter glacialis TaxID=1259555 RepID=A0A5M8QS39_9BACT|nr:DsbA family protein [Rufibacter glacialis]KAA6437784.1 DsbA family protein [Rufibacter glacialis]GGK56252.1 DsbA family protein [Rufibacter glacialis]
MSLLPGNPLLLYVTDPMCAWCYGFTPVIRRLNALWFGRLTVQVLVGGLNPYAHDPLSAPERDKLAVNWHRSQRKSLLPFDYSFFLQKDAQYDTEPACRALLTVRHLRPGLSLEVLRALHSAFFADGLDLSNTRVLVEVLRPFGIPENLFLAVFETDEIYRQTQEEFQLVEQMGVSTLPSVYLDHAQGPRLISRGFCELPELEERLLQALQIPY